LPFCQGCGKEVALGAQYCLSCGRPTSPVAQQTPAYFPLYTPQAPKSNRNLLIIVISIIVIASVIGAVVAVAFFSSAISQPNITMTNLAVGQPQGQYDSLGNCTGETLTFSFTLTNSGSGNGYAHIVLLENNITRLWENNYLVSHGQSLPVSDSTYRQSCTPFHYLFQIESQWKA
jgi:hypothetical protein